MSNPLCWKAHTGRGLGCRFIWKKGEKKCLSHLHEATSIRFRISSMKVKHHFQVFPSSSCVQVFTRTTTRQKESLAPFQNPFYPHRGHKVTALPKGSLGYFNQLPIIDMADLQSVWVSGIDLLNGFAFAFFALVESVEDPVVLILQLAVRLEPIAGRPNQTKQNKKKKNTKVALQDLCSYDLCFYINVQESPVYRKAARKTDWCQHVCWILRNHCCQTFWSFLDLRGDKGLYLSVCGPKYSFY